MFECIIEKDAATRSIGHDNELNFGSKVINNSIARKKLGM